MNPTLSKPTDLAEILAKSTHQNTHLTRNVSVRVCGKPYDWNLRGLQSQCDLRNGEKTRIELFRMAVTEMGISEAYATRLATFNAKLAKTSDFNSTIGHNGFKLHRGAVAAGMEIPSGKSIIITGGDCPTLVFVDPKTGKVIAVHAGLGELVNIPEHNQKWNVEFAARGRRYDSIVEMVGQQFSNDAKKRVLIYVFCGISANHFSYRTDDPVYGLDNWRLNNHIAHTYGVDVFKKHDQKAGHIDLVALVRSQARIFEFNPSQVFHDGVCTASSPQRWYSHARRGETGRNAVIVANHG